MFSSKPWLIFEATALFVAVPLALALHPTRLSVHASLWLMTICAAVFLSRAPGFSWRELWQGQPLTPREVALIAVRFAVSTAGIVLLTLLIDPERLFSFPMQRPGFWLLVMILYPVLSAVPQELVFRCFFFRRYAPLFPRSWMLGAASALAFGCAHIVFLNPVSPLLAGLCGLFLASSYAAHGSLKKAALEHAAYGNMVFTVGLGLYFLVHSV